MGSRESRRWEVEGGGGKGTVCEIMGGQEGSDPQKYEGPMQSSHKKPLIVNCISYYLI